MKKVFVFLTVGAALVLSSCTKTPKANLATDVDSLSYAIGVAQTNGLKMYLSQMEIDTTNLSQFIKGLNEGAAEMSKDKKAYILGLQIGQQVGGQMVSNINRSIFGSDSTKTISKDNFMAGFIAATLSKDQLMTVEEAQTYFQTGSEKIKAKAMEETHGANKAAGIKFLEENKTKEGVVTLPSGLQYKVEKEGTGAKPTSSDKVKCHYHGTLIDGTVFDSSVDRKEPAVFPVNGVIKGWTEALQLMPIGSKWTLYVPYELAYGAQEQGNIKPFSTLIFEVELISIEK